MSEQGETRLTRGAVYPGKLNVVEQGQLGINMSEQGETRLTRGKPR